jgi:hypothetical protein
MKILILIAITIVIIIGVLICSCLFVGGQSFKPKISKNIDNGDNLN